MSNVRTPGVALLISLLVGTVGLRAQESTPGHLEQRLAGLAMSYTDWVLLRDICDKAARDREAALPIVTRAVATARESGDPRYHVRVLGVLARIDDAGLEQLRAIIAGDQVGTAAVAARVLGRCGRADAALGLSLREALEAEQRPWVASAIALAAADAGATSVAPAIQARLRAGDLPKEVALWFASALAIVRKPPLRTIDAWLRSDSALADAGVLATRWHGRQRRFEELLLDRMATVEGDARDWVAQSLGVCGGESAKRVLRESYIADSESDGGAVIVSSNVDARLLALARLGEPVARRWLAKAVEGDFRSATASPSFELLTPETARLAELYGKWRCPGSTAALAARLAGARGHATSRAYAARGLCWQRDVRGLSASADLLVTPKLSTLERGLGMALTKAQANLHEFVANADRPDYVVVDDDEAAAGKVGRAWRTWLEENADAIEWREPLPGDDLIVWR